MRIRLYTSVPCSIPCCCLLDAAASFPPLRNRHAHPTGLRADTGSLRRYSTCSKIISLDGKVVLLRYVMGAIQKTSGCRLSPQHGHHPPLACHPSGGSVARKTVEDGIVATWRHKNCSYQPLLTAQHFFIFTKRNGAPQTEAAEGNWKEAVGLFFMQKNGMEPIQQCRCILQSIQCVICMNVDIQ